MKFQIRIPMKFNLVIWIDWLSSWPYSGPSVSDIPNGQLLKNVKQFGAFDALEGRQLQELLPSRQGAL